MKTKDLTCRLPTVLVPYAGPSRDPGIEDVFLYLRPESNGIVVESIILRVLKGIPALRDHTKLVYMANIPGDFIVQNRIVERHYATRLYFAVHGVNAFTPRMRESFISYFREPCDSGHVLGAFQALARLGISYDELFSIRVPERDLLISCGQIVKKIRGLYVVNYDIPALLHKNNRKTDVAVMILRTSLRRKEFTEFLVEVERILKQEKILQEQISLGRILHFSKSPFEQVLDAQGYLWDSDCCNVSLENLSFPGYLLDRGLTKKEIQGLLTNPIMLFRNPGGTLIEQDIISYTVNNSYEEAYRTLETADSQYILRNRQRTRG